MKVSNKKEMLLMEDYISNMTFDVVVPLTFNIEKHTHVSNRQEGRFGAFQSQKKIEDAEIIAVFETFRNQIARQIFLGNIKDKEPFVIDSQNAGIGMAVRAFASKFNVGHWDLLIVTVLRLTSVHPRFKAFKGQLVFKDGGIVEKVN